LGSNCEEGSTKNECIGFDDEAGMDANVDVDAVDVDVAELAGDS